LYGPPSHIGESFQMLLAAVALNILAKGRRDETVPHCA
jgi:hypothetical protein